MQAHFDQDIRAMWTGHGGGGSAARRTEMRLDTMSLSDDGFSIISAPTQVLSAVESAWASSLIVRPSSSALSYLRHREEPLEVPRPRHARHSSSQSNPTSVIPCAPPRTPHANNPLAREGPKLDDEREALNPSMLTTTPMATPDTSPKPALAPTPSHSGGTISSGEREHQRRMTRAVRFITGIFTPSKCPKTSQGQGQSHRKSIPPSASSSCASEVVSLGDLGFAMDLVPVPLLSALSSEPVSSPQTCGKDGASKGSRSVPPETSAHRLSAPPTAAGTPVNAARRSGLSLHSLALPLEEYGWLINADTHPFSSNASTPASSAPHLLQRNSGSPSRQAPRVPAIGAGLGPERSPTGLSSVLSHYSPILGRIVEHFDDEYEKGVMVDGLARCLSKEGPVVHDLSRNQHVSSEAQLRRRARPSGGGSGGVVVNSSDAASEKSAPPLASDTSLASNSTTRIAMPRWIVQTFRTIRCS